VRSLKYIVTPEGRAVKSGSTWDYEYNLTDHLGNVRAVIRKGSNGLAELIQQKHYYPFGMEMSQLNLGTGTNKYLYNSKEIQDDFNLYWYDYGARFYDPGLGRWHSVDPLAKKYPGFSPYNYCFNNPLNSVDPDGREPLTIKILAGAAIGAGTDITAQMTINMTIKDLTFREAFRSLDWTSVGSSALLGAIAVPGLNIASKTKSLTIASAISADALMDASFAEGNKNLIQGDKSFTNTGIDVVSSIMKIKVSDDILKGAKKSIGNDINSGSYSTLTKADKSKLKGVQEAVNSKSMKAGTETITGIGTEAGKEGIKSIIGSPGGYQGNPAIKDYSQPVDNLRVDKPIYHFIQ
jgi:RHS repeat-associated protein